jgi:uncharacterized membrane protein YkvI
MGLFDSRAVRVYLVPGAVLQSVIVAGGYGTGRELVEYFTRFGAVGGLFGLGVTFICWALVLGVTWEFARVFRVYDYRSFFRELLGRGWIAFELLYVLMFLLVLAVVGSAAGEILSQQFRLPYAVGLILMLATVGALVFFGRELITRVLTVWTLVLYTLFIGFFAAVMVRSGSTIWEQLSTGGTASGWAVSGFVYAMYNVAVVPAILFSVRAIETRREAVGAGIAAAAICTVPALLFHISFLAGYPGITGQQIPVYWLIGQLGMPLLLLAYTIGLFGTFIETGAGFIHGINERIDALLRETRRPPLGKPARAAIAVSGIAISAALGSFGIIALIARGYGTISWGFFGVYVVPVMTYGVYRLATRGPDATAAAHDGRAAPLQREPGV